MSNSQRLQIFLIFFSGGGGVLLFGEAGGGGILLKPLGMCFYCYFSYDSFAK